MSQPTLCSHPGSHSALLQVDLDNNRVIMESAAGREAVARGLIFAGESGIFTPEHVKFVQVSRPPSPTYRILSNQNNSSSTKEGQTHLILQCGRPSSPNTSQLSPPITHNSGPWLPSLEGFLQHRMKCSPNTGVFCSHRGDMVLQIVWACIKTRIERLWCEGDQQG